MGNRQSMPAASGWPALGTVTAYAAAILPFAYALMSLYWALGGHGLVSTTGGYAEQFPRRGGMLPVVIALAATLAKVAGGLLALALVRPWGRAVPRRWLLAGSAVASARLRAQRWGRSGDPDARPGRSSLKDGWHAGAHRHQGDPSRQYDADHEKGSPTVLKPVSYAGCWRVSKVLLFLRIEWRRDGRVSGRRSAVH
jgi:hypothetical protein